MILLYVRTNIASLLLNLRPNIVYVNYLLVFATWQQWWYPNSGGEPMAYAPQWGGDSLKALKVSCSLS